MWKGEGSEEKVERSLKYVRYALLGNYERTF